MNLSHFNRTADDILYEVKKTVSSFARIDLFDLLRGYFVFVIVIDHLERWPGVFDWVSGQGRLWASAAEGFFIVSGIMIGLIRGRKEIDEPLWSITKKLWQRGLQLYLWAVLLSLLFSVWGYLWPNETAYMPPGLLNFQGEATVWNFLFRTFILEHSYGWAGFLKFYAIYIALAPIAIWLLRKKLWWILLSVSTLLWVYGLNQDNWWFSWQLLFYGGAILGFYVPEIRGWWENRPRLDRQLLTSLLLSVSAAIVVLSVFFVHGWNLVKPTDNPFMSYQEYDTLRRIIDPYFDRVSLQPLRLITALLWFGSLVILFSHFQSFIKKWFGWLLMTYGQNSLYVYILHGIAVFAIDLLIPRTANILLNVMLIIAVVMSLWFITKKRILFTIIPR